jgi:hypothetical protein
VCASTHGHQSTNAFSTSVCLFLSRPILNSVRSVARVTHASCIPSTSVTRDGARHKYEWSSQHQHAFSKSVCLFLSRPILSSVRSVPRAITPLATLQLQSHETVLVCTSTHGHQSTNTFSKSVCLFLSRPILNSVRSGHHAFGISPPS